MLGFITPSLAMADPTTVAVAPADTTAVTATATAGAADVAQAGPLSDVPLNSWAYDAVNQLAKDGIIKGYPDGTFKGNRPMTRYEAAVLAYRAVDMIEAQITAGKAVEKADIDAANKLIAAYGAELKAVERHVDALQTEADSTAKTVAGHSSQIQALSDFDKKAAIHFYSVNRAFTYNGNINGNCPNIGQIAPGNGFCSTVAPGTALPQGTRTGGYGAAYGTSPGGNIGNAPIGQFSRGVSFSYDNLSFSGTPSANTAFLIQLSDSIRPVQATGNSSAGGQADVCSPSYSGQNFLNGNLAIPAAQAFCSPQNAPGSLYYNGEPGGSLGYNNIWGQVSIPKSGIYFRAGHVQNNEGPTGGSWLLGDYYWGAQIGMTKGNFNGYVGAGVGNSTSTNTVQENIPNQVQEFVIEADYTFPVTNKFSVNVGGDYVVLTGENSQEWDPQAITCVGANGALAYVATTAAQTGNGCGSVTATGRGYLPTPALTPVAYVNGAPVQGAYLSQINNSPTYSGTGCSCIPASAGGPGVPGNFIYSLSTPGLAGSTPIAQVGAHLIFTYANARLYLAGSMRLGNDPYTGTAFTGNTTGDFLFDIGPWRSGPGNHGKLTYEAQGFAAGFNGLTQNQYYFAGAALNNSWSTNIGGQYFLETGVKYWVSDNVSLGVGVGRMGLLPNVSLPAGNVNPGQGVSCAGCSVTGLGQNMAFLEMGMAF